MEYSGLNFNTIDQIVKHVDIVRLQNDLDGAAVGTSDETVISSGIIPLNEVVKKILAPYSDKYFFEYALLPSTLDPDKEKLYSMSAIQVNGDNTDFKDDIEKNVKNIIETLYKEHKDNFFHNPETFLAPSGINIVHSFSDSLDADVAVRNKQKREKYDVVLQNFEQPPNKYFQATEGLFFSNMTYKRKFEDIITNANKISGECQGDSAKLKAHYESGAADLRYFYDLYIKNEDENACYITMPIISSSSEGFPQLYRQFFKKELNGKLQGIGVFFIYFILKDQDALEALKQPRNIQSIRESLFIEVNNIIRIFTYNLVFNIGLRLFERAKENSIKSAVAAIMARNMSHNLGSHVITNAKYQIENLAKQHKEPLARQLNGVSKLLQYLQERQDFIAVIANDERYAKGPMNFKNAVFDMIAMDGPAVRHQSIESDDSTKINNYILDNIVRSEGIFRKDSVSVEGTIEIEIQLVTKVGRETLVFKSFGQNDSESKEFNNFICAVPYGLNGRQAFLTIIENIIRNSAKHGKEKLNQLNGEPLTFPIIINETSGNQFEIIVSDNKKDFAEVIAAFAKNSIIDPKTGQLHSLKILSESGHGIDKSNKGIKEILICLAWMKSTEGIIDYSQIQDKPAELAEIVGVNENYEYFDIKTCNEAGNSENLSMGYKFYVDKHLLVYTITDEEYKRQLLTGFSQLPAASIYLVSPHYLHHAKLYLPRVTIPSGVNTPEALLSNIIKNELYGSDESLPALLISESDSAKKEYSDFDAQTVRRQYGGTDITIDQPFIHFRNHYEAEKLAIAKNREDLGIKEGSLFSEGISGGNYTHNLIRTDITEFTYLQIVEAALTKIAIVDERIFSKYRGLTPAIAGTSKFYNQQVAVEEIAGELFSAAKKQYFPFVNDFSNALQRLLRNHEGFTVESSFDNEFEMRFQRDPLEIKKALFTHLRYHGSLIEEGPAHPIADYLEHKNIFILNCDEEGMIFDLRGRYINQSTEFRFDFVSLHLSLLEKITLNENRDINKKLTDILCTYKLQKSKISLHSGRGGLTKINDVTFIPLSGIDWALDNCKYVLAELFYGLKYHPVRY